MYKNKEILAQKYKELGSLNKVAEYFGISKKLVLNYMKKYDIPRNTPNKDKTPKDRRKNNNYHKGYKITASGYKKIRVNYDHPKKDSSGYVHEHVLVMEQKLGRYLKEDEVVHHIDRNRLNNSIENLQLMNKSDHKCMHSREDRKKIDVEKAAKMLDDGYVYEQVSSYFGISESGLRKKLKRSGINLSLKKGGARRKRFDCDKI